jgi:formate dehydrogenase subunit gamma
MTQPPETVTRYATVTRLNHWLTAICFVLLTLSGLSMFHPIFFWLSNLFGGGQWTRAVHPWIGLVLVASYAGLVWQFWRDNLWTPDDEAWVRKIDRVLVNDEEHVPEVARFNAGQKFVFWAMALLLPVLLFTGLVIWEVYFGAFTPIVVQRFAVLIHSLAAIAAILVWIVHVYAGIWVRGSMRAMTQGWVTPGWAWRHHRKWLRQL